MKHFISLFAIVFCNSFLLSCADQDLKKTEITWKQNQQVILVLSSDWNASHGLLFRFIYKKNHWVSAGHPFTVSLGKNGIAWTEGMPLLVKNQIMKTEGDMRSPAGIFKIGKSFGYDLKINISYPYKALTKDDYCIDNSQSIYYNQIINHQQISFDIVNDSTEPMRRDLHLNGDQSYKLGFVINYNPQNKPKAGSCIFAHLRQDSYSTTAGCTSMDEKNMKGILKWLDIKNDPLFILLPRDIYQINKIKWNLPKIKISSVYDK